MKTDKAKEYLKSIGWFDNLSSIDLMAKLLTEYEKQVLTAYTDFLLKEGYCDSDVYCESPTAIDQFLTKN